MTLRLTLLAIVAALAAAVAVPYAGASPAAAALGPRLRPGRPGHGRVPLSPPGGGAAPAGRLPRQRPVAGDRLGPRRSTGAGTPPGRGLTRPRAGSGSPSTAARAAPASWPRRPPRWACGSATPPARGSRSADVSIETSRSTVPAGPAEDPLQGVRFFVDPDSSARAQAAAWRSSRPGDAALIDRIAAQPQAEWFGDWSGDVARRRRRPRRRRAGRPIGAHPRRLQHPGPRLRPALGGRRARRRGLPGLDRSVRRGPRRCARGGHPGAGRAGRAWTASTRPASASASGCWPGPCAAARRPARRGRVPRRRQHRVAGAPGDGPAPRRRRGGAGARVRAQREQLPHDTRQPRLRARHLPAGRGQALRRSTPGRNGAGPSPDGAWCNPPGRALGEEPTTDTGDPLVDAYLWIKPPGDSDGTCQGGRPPAPGGPSTRWASPGRPPRRADEVPLTGARCARSGSRPPCGR